MKPTVTMNDTLQPASMDSDSCSTCQWRSLIGRCLLVHVWRRFRLPFTRSAALWNGPDFAAFLTPNIQTEVDRRDCLNVRRPLARIADE